MPPKRTPGSAVQLAAGEPKQTALPRGFFEDKKADAKARGEKLPDRKDKEDEFQAFQQSLEADLKDLAEKEAEEEEEAAQDREERENYEQMLRVQRVEQLRQHSAGTSHPLNGNENPVIPAHDVRQLKRRRVKDTLASLVIAAGGSDEDGSDGDDSDEETVVDWRAKAV